MFVDLTKPLNRISRSICPENLTGDPGKGGATPWEEGFAKDESRDLGTGWKVNPYIVVQPGETLTLCDIKGMGKIRHIWCTVTKKWRNSILRMYWDGQENPSVETPIGDFFCMGWQQFMQINSLAVCVNPGSGFNCYWEMPFRTEAKMTLENRAEEPMTIYYQIDYSLEDIPEDCMYFHAQFRRTNPLPYKTDYTILDGVKGCGHYVGTYIAWGVNNNGWWGEGEIKFFMDGDTQYPTICGTGTEDYFCGSYDFENPFTRDCYMEFSSPYCGFQEIKTDRLYRCQKRFGMYRWHLTDPICFEKELKVTIQALGWREGHRFLPLQDDIASVAYWYQQLPAAPFPVLPDKDYLEVI